MAAVVDRSAMRRSVSTASPSGGVWPTRTRPLATRRARRARGRKGYSAPSRVSCLRKRPDPSRRNGGLSSTGSRPPTVTESDFIEVLYAGSDDQQKSYLRQEYPTLLSHHQERFTVWPRPTQVCPVTPYSGRCAATSIAPSPCLATLIDTLRTSLGWTRHETSAFLKSLQTTAHVHSAVDYVCARRQALTLPLSVAYPRITRAVWSTLDEAAQQLLTPDDTSYIASLPSYVCS
ncbi:hypothetical protein SPRG_18309 [Saprolegnia parasitica CBS 223.65]|uniref:Uncharacterized protein n=1 Tax=Saprolegnia parasitica (strain CBS 223.65) TaxID=695850 RepID=A0A067BCT7_SAPPC|nr:hypothetical protein SPRG_18309 [Saprolegnia parasitica CBS 223.65]KDO16154.1 hypothetical protein SPRG_18309 [Saprolegnia parasitica CBS 223.65]|eukprot:XP_012213137.1 hypothetical protein SPRG_18309 [Saprolegnia parasitica CBS 223.65]